MSGQHLGATCRICGGQVPQSHFARGIAWLGFHLAARQRRTGFHNLRMALPELSEAERERILKETLVTAQQASEDIRAQASKQAELILREAQGGAERLTHNALQRSAALGSSAPTSRDTRQLPAKC